MYTHSYAIGLKRGNGPVLRLGSFVRAVGDSADTRRYLCTGVLVSSTVHSFAMRFDVTGGTFTAKLTTLLLP